MNLDETEPVPDQESKPPSEPDGIAASLPEAPPVPVVEPAPTVEVPRKDAHVLRTLSACVAAALIPGLGHAILGKWDRAIVFLGTLSLMFVIGLNLRGQLFGPDFSNLFSSLKFIADAGMGLIYWLCLQRGLGVGDPAAYSYDFANVFIYVAGLLNMLVIVDAFDIAQERKP